MALTKATVETAINTILSGGQSFTIDGVTFNQASLATLYDLRDKLDQEELRTAGSRPVFRAFNFGTMGYGASGNVADADIVRTVTA